MPTDNHALRRLMREGPKMQFTWPVRQFAVVVVSAGIGLGAGASGIVSGNDSGAPTDGPVVNAIVAGPADASRLRLPGSDCPGGAVIGELEAGDRILAIRRSGTAVEVRDPRNLGRTMWVDTRWLVPDPDNDLAFADLPEGGCDDELLNAATPTAPPSSSGDADETTVPPTTAAPGSTTAPTSTTRPPTSQPTVTQPSTTVPRADTTAPTLGKLEAIGSNELCEHPAPSGAWPTSITYRIVASDDVGVSSVTATWPNGPSGLPGGPVVFALTGGVYQATIGPFPSTSLASGDRTVAVTITAVDAAGNAKTTTTSLTLIDQGDCIV